MRKPARGVLALAIVSLVLGLTGCFVNRGSSYDGLLDRAGANVRSTTDGVLTSGTPHLRVSTDDFSSENISAIMAATGGAENLSVDILYQNEYDYTVAFLTPLSAAAADTILKSVDTYHANAASIDSFSANLAPLVYSYDASGTAAPIPNASFTFSMPDEVGAEGRAVVHAAVSALPDSEVRVEWGRTTFVSNGNIKNVPTTPESIGCLVDAGVDLRERYRSQYNSARVFVTGFENTYTNSGRFRNISVKSDVSSPYLLDLPECGLPVNWSSH